MNTNFSDIKITGTQDDPSCFVVKKQAGSRVQFASVKVEANIEGVSGFNTPEGRDLACMMPEFRSEVHRVAREFAHELFGDKVRVKTSCGTYMFDPTQFSASVCFINRIPTDGTTRKDLIAKEDLEAGLLQMKPLIEQAFQSALEIVRKHTQTRPVIRPRRNG